MKTLTEINLEKSRSGIYKDNAENRRLHRVGQRYGSPGREEDPAAAPLNNRRGGSIVNRSGKSKEEGSKNKQGVSGVYLYGVKKDGSVYSKPEFHRFIGDEKSAEDVISRLEKQNPGQKFVKDKDSGASLVGGEELKVKVNPDLKIGDTLLDLYSKEDFDTVKNGGHITIMDGDRFVSKIERRNNEWWLTTQFDVMEISSDEVYARLKMWYANERKNKQEGKKMSFSLQFNPKPQPKPQPKPTTESQKKEYIDRVKKMSDDELAHIALGYSAEKYAKANAAYEKAKAAFKKKWGDGISGMIDRISSLKDVDELLKDSEELGKKLTAAQTSSPYTPETIQALRRRVINQLKKGVSIDDVEVRNFAVQHQRSYWKEGDFTARQGEFLADALQRDFATLPARGGMGDLYWTESTLEKYFDTKLSAKEFNKLVDMVAEHQGRKPNRRRGESTIGGFEDFKRVMSNLDTEDGQPKDKEPEVQQGKENFTRVNLPDIPNAHKVNLKKYLSAKRKAAVDEAWNKAGFDSVPKERFMVLQKSYNKLREQFNNNFDSMSKAERAELLYRILKMKNAMEKKS